MARRRLTKKWLNAAMKRIERNPRDIVGLQAGAGLIGASFEIDIDGGLLYRGVYYPDHAELVDDLLCDLGAKRNSLYQYKEEQETDFAEVVHGAVTADFGMMDGHVSSAVRAYPPIECPWTEKLSWGL